MVRGIVAAEMGDGDGGVNLNNIVSRVAFLNISSLWGVNSAFAKGNKGVVKRFSNKGLRRLMACWEVPDF